MVEKYLFSILLFTSLFFILFVSKNEANNSNDINELESFTSDHNKTYDYSQILDIDGTLSHQNRFLTSILEDSSIKYHESLTVYYDPPSMATSATALGVFVRASLPDAKIYYEIYDAKTGYRKITSSSPYATYASPYIQIDTPYLSPRTRHLQFVAVLGTKRSSSFNLTYFVEAGSRPYSYAFLVPGLETKGYFLKAGIEMKATARAQTAGGQEFADFFTALGVGSYKSQVVSMLLQLIDPDLKAFEGGLAVNCSNNKHYGILVPYHNGEKFFGKVVRVNLRNFTDNSTFLSSWRKETLNTDGTVSVTGVDYHSDPLVTILDLSSIHAYARGFRRGFVGYPYVYLAPGEFNVAVRLDMEHFNIGNVSVVDLDLLDSTLGGYSGGFVDGSWACYTPFRSYYGPIGGIRSKLEVDRQQLRSFYHGRMLCLNESAWSNNSNSATSYRTMDFSNMLPDLRGFSDSIRVGRYAYFSPFSSLSHSYFGRLVRLDLGSKDVGTAIDYLNSEDLPVSTNLRVLDLSIVNPDYKGFSGIFTAGLFIYLVPYRNAHEPQNGQRGHGNFVRVNMNDFSVSGVDGVDLSVVTRTQVPSFPDQDLRGFVSGFASGKYGLLVPFYNAVFSGKVARCLIFQGPALSFVKYSESMTPEDLNLQELDLTINPSFFRDKNATVYTTEGEYDNIFKGFRGGFVSLWQGVDSD